MKSKADVVVIGGGIIGCSLLFGLSALKCETVLVEAGTLGAGLSSLPPRALQLPARRIENLDASHTQSYQTLFLQHIERVSGKTFFYTHEKDTWTDTGFIAHARNEHMLELQQMMHNFHRQFETITTYNHFIDNQHLDEHAIPLINNIPEGYLYQLIMESFTLKPLATLQTLAEAAKVTGGEYQEQCAVRAISKNEDGTWQIDTTKGKIIANHVVNAAGNAANHIAAMTQHQLPLRSVQHYCFLLENAEDFFNKGNLPSNYLGISDDFYLYVHDKYLVLNLFAENRTIISDDVVTDDVTREKMRATVVDFKGNEIVAGEKIACNQHDFPELQEDFARIFALMPELKDRITHYIPSDILVSPDGKPLIGEIDDNLWLACGFTEGFSQEILVRIGLASLIADGDHRTETVDITEFSPVRFSDKDQDWIKVNIEKNPFYRHDDNNCAFPDQHKVPPHPLQQEFISDNAALMAGKQFATPQFFTDKQAASHNPEDNIAVINQEQIQMRTIGGYYDIGHHAKFEISGKDAEKFVSFISAGKQPNQGEMKVAPIINKQGKPHTMLTLGCLDDNLYWLIGDGDRHHIDHAYLLYLQKQAKMDVTINNITATYGGIAIAGLQAQTLFSQFSDETLPFFGIAKTVIEGIETVIVKFSITGEKGYEIYAPNQHINKLYQAIRAKANDADIKPIGFYALQALRLEAGFPIWQEMQGIATLYGLGMQNHIDYDKQDFWQKPLLEKQRYVKQYPLFQHMKLIGVGKIDHIGFLEEKHIKWQVLKQQDFCDISTLYYQRPFLHSSLAYAAHSKSVYGFGWLNTEILSKYIKNPKILMQKPTISSYLIDKKTRFYFEAELTVNERLEKLGIISATD
ncbi:MAG: FAD-dependent oxidoreductase [Alphaproteobacteria bacterium]|nr:FAD-dependent oxidoreductase [Alphaproteobacteria bacterium]